MDNYNYSNSRKNCKIIFFSDENIGSILQDNQNLLEKIFAQKLLVFMVGEKINMEN